jgi:LuxR family maltose regulon positive regulatory protein
VETTTAAPADHRSAHDRRSLREPSFELVESKLHPPRLRPGIVPRTALVERLLATPAAQIICVVGPAGYGKTTLLVQWANRSGRRVAWVTVDPHDNDPVVLLAYLAVALDRIQPIDPEIFHTLASPGSHVLATVVPRLVAAMSAMSKPVALVLDHVELLHDRACLDVVVELAVRLPGSSLLALASRTRPRLPLALRRQGRVVELDATDLAMDQSEARALLERAQVRLADEHAAELHRRTEGWPVGLYLAALALRAGAGIAVEGDAEAGFAGDDRLVADYLHAGLLGRLSGDEVAFLTRTAVLDRMCGPLCDAVVGTQGSAGVLRSMDRANLLLVPLDRRRQWYRYHHLFRDLLRAELGRREPELIRQLHVRAAAWFEANGLPETAIDHA